MDDDPNPTALILSLKGPTTLNLQGKFNKLLNNHYNALVDHSVKKYNDLKQFSEIVMLQILT